MRTQSAKRKRNSLKLIVPLTIMVILLVGWLYYAHSSKMWPFLQDKSTNQPDSTDTIDYKTPSSEQSEEGESIKQQAAEKIEPTSDDKTAEDSIPITITSVQPGSTVYIRTVIGVVSSSGTCELSMVGPNGKTYTATSGLQAMASSSTCKGFNIPMSELSSGSWQIDISVTTNSKTGRASAQETL